VRENRQKIFASCLPCFLAYPPCTVIFFISGSALISRFTCETRQFFEILKTVKNSLAPGGLLINSLTLEPPSIGLTSHCPKARPLVRRRKEKTANSAALEIDHLPPLPAFAPTAPAKRVCRARFHHNAGTPRMTRNVFAEQSNE
jgi:hypothetical protein